MVDPEIPSVFWWVGGTPPDDFERAAAGRLPVPSHHSSFCKIAPGPARPVSSRRSLPCLRSWADNAGKPCGSSQFAGFGSEMAV